MDNWNGKGLINLRPNPPEKYGGKRKYLAVCTWVYKMEQYLNLMQMMAPGVVLNDNNRITYATSFLIDTAAVWWFTKVQANSIPTTWQQFVMELKAEFVPADYIRNARSKIRTLKQFKSVPEYLSEFRKIVLTITNIAEDEKLDKYLEGLREDIRLEVMKSSVITFEEEAQLSLTIDGALYGADQLCEG